MLKQHLQLKLSQKLSPQQIQLMKLIQLPTQAFEERIKQEIEENPALEPGKEVSEDPFEIETNNELESTEETHSEEINIDEYLSDDDTPDYKTSISSSSTEDENQTPYAAGQTFYGYLTEQLSTFNLEPEQYLIAEYLVGSLDESGYLRRPTEDIIDDLAFSVGLFINEEQLIKALMTVQQLDPAGIGARDIAECLSLQLKRQAKNPSRDLAIKIIDESFDLFSKKHFEKILQKHKMSLAI
jgi:RNA polymerase sigma-54 factor